MSAAPSRTPGAAARPAPPPLDLPPPPLSPTTTAPLGRRSRSYEGNCSPSLFDKAKKEAYLLMARDTYRRFVREDEFQALLDTLGSYKGKTSLAQVNLTSIKVELV